MKMKLKLKELIESGARNLATWNVVRDGDNTILAVNDCDNQRTVELDATEEYGEAADDLYAAIIREYGEGYPADRDPNRFWIWQLDRDNKHSYTLYIMIDNYGSDPVFLASGSGECIYRSFDEVLLGWFEIA
jgi:hypothetical protein